jgi:hypothetical protein
MVSETLFNFLLAFGCGYFVGVAITHLAYTLREKREQKKTFNMLINAADSAISHDYKEKH